jgi:hypothetical protein
MSTFTGILGKVRSRLGAFQLAGVAGVAQSRKQISTFTGILGKARSRLGAFQLAGVAGVNTFLTVAARYRWIVIPKSTAWAVEKRDIRWVVQPKKLNV